jgi:hypothetical protein
MCPFNNFFGTTPLKGLKHCTLSHFLLLMLLQIIELKGIAFSDVQVHKFYFFSLSSAFGTDQPTAPLSH